MEEDAKIAAQNLDGYLFIGYTLSRKVVPNEVSPNFMASQNFYRTAIIFFLIQRNDIG